MISFMKHTKDRMANPMSLGEITQLVTLAKQIGATHCEVATVMGHPNFASHSKLWADEIHAQGLSVTWRCAHQNMEGLYGAPKYVGVDRISPASWIAIIQHQISLIKDLIKPGDECALLPERTENIWQDATSWFWPNTGDNYAKFFIDLHNSLKIYPWTVGLSANNASELFSGWMPHSLSDTFGVTVVDHYHDGDPILYEQEVRKLKSLYGKQVYVQEGAPHRFIKPTAIYAKNYFDANKRLDEDGILYGFGSWSGWAGTPEAIFDLVGGLWFLNEQGKALKDWWNPTAPLPDLAKVVSDLITELGSQKKLSAIRTEIYSSHSSITKVNEVKKLL